MAQKPFFSKVDLIKEKINVFEKVNFNQRLWINALLGATLISAIHSGLSLAVAIIITSCVAISRLVLGRGSLMNGSPVFLIAGLTYASYFSINSYMTASVDLSYIKNSLIYVVLAFNVILLGIHQKQIGLSVKISVGLIIIFLLYVFMKAGCEFEIFSHEFLKDVFQDPNKCYRVRFGSRNALMTGAMIATLTALCYADVPWSKPLPSILATFGIAAGAALVAFGTQSRGAMLALLVTVPLGFTWIYVQHGFSALTKHVFKLVMILSIALLSLNLIGGDGKHLIKRINAGLNLVLETETADNSINTRLEMYRSGVNAFLESPVIGYGYENMYKSAARLGSLPMDRHAHLHNAILNHLVAGGIFGLIVYLLLYLPFWRTIKNFQFFTTDFDFALTQFYVSFFMIGLTTSTNGHFAMNAFFAITLVLLLCSKENGAQRAKEV